MARTSTDKLTGQASVLRLLGEPQAATRIEERSSALAAADSLDRCREIEAQAANAYFACWTRRVRPTFITNDRPRIPPHWLTFDGRRSVIDRGRSPRKAATPINATLNYAYALAEAECRLALLAVGLDPGLGIMHADAKGRDSLALDIIEPLRPIVDRDILDLHTTQDSGPPTSTKAPTAPAACWHH